MARLGKLIRWKGVKDVFEDIKGAHFTGKSWTLVVRHCVDVRPLNFYRDRHKQKTKNKPMSSWPCLSAQDISYTNTSNPWSSSSCIFETRGSSRYICNWELGSTFFGGTERSGNDFSFSGVLSKQHTSKEKKTGYLGYTGDYTTQWYGDYNDPWNKDP